MKTKYITLDYDLEKITNQELRDCIYGLIKVFDNVWIRRSASGMGFHVLIELDYPIEVLETFYFREAFKDDPDRLMMDIERYNTGSEIIGVLFDKKNDKNAGEWENVKTKTDLFSN